MQRQLHRKRRFVRSPRSSRHQQDLKEHNRRQRCAAAKKNLSFHNINGYVDSNYFPHSNLHEPSRFVSVYEPNHRLSYQNQLRLSNGYIDSNRIKSIIVPVKSYLPIQIDQSIQSKTTTTSTPSSTKEPVKKKKPLINITNVNPLTQQATTQIQKKNRGRPALPRDENGKIIRK
ncbi:unnamed protein product [Brachionus calyciflorus]|uniref:Uncharacterized protein n=1 Tax=Brachionus calyciflorus TaxID=104777 RepID=A0A813SAL5_9BILA|nr:unnamed protein product [Brachionus calyciflorus]